MDFAATQGYSNTYPGQYNFKPRAPIAGKRAITTIETIFEYDIITPYGIGANVVSNVDQATLYMVAWGMIVRLSLLAPGPATLTILADLLDGTYTEISTSPVAVASDAKIQTFTFGPIPAFKIRGRLTGDGSTYTYHVSCTDY